MGFQGMGFVSMPNLPTNIIPIKIARLKLSVKFPMDMRIPPLIIKIMLVSNPLKSTMLVGGLGVATDSIVICFYSILDMFKP